MPVPTAFARMLLGLYAAAVLDELDGDTQDKLNYIMGSNWINALKEYFAHKKILRQIRLYKTSGMSARQIGNALAWHHLKYNSSYSP
jgi:hypothetical protein